MPSCPSLALEALSFPLPPALQQEVACEKSLVIAANPCYVTETSNIVIKMGGIWFKKEDWEWDVNRAYAEDPAYRDEEAAGPSAGPFAGPSVSSSTTGSSIAGCSVGGPSVSPYEKLDRIQSLRERASWAYLRLPVVYHSSAYYFRRFPYPILFDSSCSPRLRCQKPSLFRCERDMSLVSKLQSHPAQAVSSSSFSL